MIDMLNSLGHSWWAWMWPMCWQVALLAALVWIMDLFLRRRGWPQVRYALWLLVLVKLIIPPTFSLPTSVSARAIDVGRPKLAAVAPGMLTPVNVEPVSSEPDFSAVAREQILEASSGAPIELDTTELPAPKRPALSLQAWLMFASSAVSLLLFLLLMLRTRRLRRRVLSDANPDGVRPWMNEVLQECARNLRLKKLPRLVVTEHVGSAAVLGVFRPVLLLPREASANASREEMSHILLHELAHVKRGDLVANALQTLLHIVYWFHPLVWLTGKRLRHLRELCCDATVSTVLKERTSEYRRTIMKASEKMILGSTGASLGLLGLFENASRLRQRLEHLTRPAWKHPRLRMIASLTAAALMLACILPMAGGKGASHEADVRKADGPGWGEVVEGMQAGMLVARRSFALDKPILATFLLRKAKEDTSLPARISLPSIGLHWTTLDHKQDGGSMYRGLVKAELKVKNVPVGAVFLTIEFDLTRAFLFVPPLNKDCEIKLDYILRREGGGKPIRVTSGPVTIRVNVPEAEVIRYYVTELLAEQPRDFLRARAGIPVPYPIDELLDVGRPAVVRLSSLLRKDEDPEIRRKAANALGYFGAKAQVAVSTLCELLKDQDASVREETVSALGKIGSATAVAALRETLQAEKSSRELTAIYDALRQITGLSEVAWGEVSNGLQCRLLPERQTTVVPERPNLQGVEVYVIYELRNVLDQELRFCPFYNPLEGVMGDIFDVVGPKGQKLRYGGEMVSRVGPRKNHFISLAPGHVLSRRVRLQYDFRQVSSYQVSVTTVAEQAPAGWQIMAYYERDPEQAKRNPDNVWTGTLKSNIVTVNIIRPKLAEDVGADPTAPAWGEAVEGVQPEVRNTTKERALTVSDVAAYHRARTGEELSDEELKKVYTDIALRESQTGGDPYRLEEDVRWALAFQQDDLTRLLLYVYLGDAYWRQTKKYTPEEWGPQRRKAAEAYLTGLHDVLRHELPAEPPELPSVGRYHVGGPPEVVEQYREKHARELAARREAERIRELVQFRQMLTGQLVQMYGREPDAFEELRQLVLKHIGSEEPAEKLEAAAKAYRKNPKTAIPALDSISPEPWGEAVEGVQCRLRADRLVWEGGEVPVLKADVRNSGKRDLLVFRADMAWKLEFDGKWFEQKEIGAQMSFFPPGKRYDDIPITLGDRWVTPRDDERLRLEPGKHTVRVAFICEPTRSAPGKPVRATSNPVEIAISGRPGPTPKAEVKEEPAIFKELSEQIAWHVQQDKWSPASRELIKTLWQEYKRAYVQNEPKMSWSGPVEPGQRIEDARPDIKDYYEYLGKYSESETEPEKIFLEVVADPQGRFIVKLEGHEIPALAWNKGILFTAGNVIYSSLPGVGAGPHATLEYFLITRINGQYIFTGNIAHPLYDARKLFKVKDE